MNQVLAFIPELILIFGALLSLMLGAFGYPRASHINLLFTLFVACVGLLTIAGNEEIKILLLHTNSFIKFLKLLVLIAALIVLLLLPKIQFEVGVLMLLSTLGSILMISSDSLITLYMSFELMSLPLYIISSSQIHNSKSSEAGLKYFILGSISSALFLLGASFIYGFSGSTLFDDIQHYSAAGDTAIIKIGFLIGLILILVAFSFKLSAAPFHMWTIDVYQGAPTIITMYLASVPKSATLITLILLLKGPFIEAYVQWQQILSFIAIVSMFVGSIGGIMQSNFKRLLAYSSIGHIGFMLCGLASQELEGLSGILTYLIIYLTLTIGCFGYLMMLRKGQDSIENLDNFKGLAKSHPNTALMLAILMLSMAGIPPTGGFFAKFYILIPLMKANMFYVAVLFMLASVMAAYYYLKVIKVMYFEEPIKGIEVCASIPFKGLITAMVIFNVIYIFIPQYIYEILAATYQEFFK